MVSRVDTLAYTMDYHDIYELQCNKAKDISFHSRSSDTAHASGPDQIDFFMHSTPRRI